MYFDNREDILRITSEWKGERFPNGRPKVPSDILRRIARINIEEAWGPLWHKGYTMQFEGGFQITRPEKTIVGRAVTAVFVPRRPDLHDSLLSYGHEVQNRKGFFNQWIIDNLEEDDIVVVDLFDKVYKGTFIGGNLATAIASKTKRGGAVIWGGIRDTQQIAKIDAINVYHRGGDPTAIGDVTMSGLNVPCRIGQAICLPGDVVLGTPYGVIFIPAHLAEYTVTQAEKSQIRDIFGFARLAEGKYTTAQIDTTWVLPIWEDFVEWFETAEETKDYRYLNWDKELEEARKMDSGPTSDVRL